MHIKIDCREAELLKNCLAFAELRNVLPSAIKITSESLPLGDIIIYDAAGVEKAIFERKSLADLASSIRDGRYKEQSFRLNACSLHNHTIYYLVEGDLRFYKPYKSNIDQHALMSAMISVSYFKGFSVYRTMNGKETAEFILQFAIKLLKENKPSFYLDPVVDEAKYSAMLTKRTKKENITQQNIGEVMLSQIPYVSNTVAAAVMQKFTTMSQLLDALKTDKTVLNDIMVLPSTTSSSKTKRRINKTCIANIYKYLLSSPANDDDDDDDDDDDLPAATAGATAATAGATAATAEEEEEEEDEEEDAASEAASAAAVA
jgi:ERCC4-type nuclease